MSLPGSLQLVSRRGLVVVLAAVAVGAVVVGLRLQSSDERALVGYWRAYDRDGEYEGDVQFAAGGVFRTRIGRDPFADDPYEWRIVDGTLWLRRRVSLETWIRAVWHQDRLTLDGAADCALEFVSDDEVKLIGESSGEFELLKRITADTPPVDDGEATGSK